MIVLELKNENHVSLGHEVARMAQWLERRAQRSDDPCVGVRIPLWDVGTGFPDETV